MFVCGLGTGVFLHLERHSYNWQGRLRHSYVTLRVLDHSFHPGIDTTRIFKRYGVLRDTGLVKTRRPEGKSLSKRAASLFVHLEKFGLRFPKSFLWIFLNLLHSWPSLDLHGCFNIHEGLGMANNMRLNEVKWGLICVSSIRPFLTFRHRPFTSISSWVRYSNSLVTGFWP